MLLIYVCLDSLPNGYALRLLLCESYVQIFSKLSNLLTPVSCLCNYLNHNTVYVQHVYHLLWWKSLSIIVPVSQMLSHWDKSWLTKEKGAGSELVLWGDNITTINARSNEDSLILKK